MSESALSRFASIQADYDKANANFGFGSAGERPPEGVWANYITDIEINDSGVTFRDGSNDLPAVSVVFRYRMIDAIPNHPEDNPLEWEGAMFRIPLDASAITNKGATVRYNMELERLKGHLSTLNGTVLPLTEALRQAKLKVETSKVAAKVTCSYRRGKPRKDPVTGQEITTEGTPTYFSEYLTALISR